MKPVLLIAALALASAVAAPLALAQDSRPAPPPSISAAPDSVLLPLTPSQMLDAPQGAWASVHAWVEQQLQVQEAGIASMDRDAQIQLRISQALLAQSQGQWDRVSAPVERARRLQFGQPGRHVAGLLNELLAEQQARRHPDAWLRSAIRDRVLAMPWDEVGGVIHQLRQQLQAMQADAVRAFVTNRLDLSANFAQGRVSFGFVLQLMGARIQVQQVLPHRDSLVQGLDEAIAQRPALVTQPAASSPGG